MYYVLGSTRYTSTMLFLDSETGLEKLSIYSWAHGSNTLICTLAPLFKFTHLAWHRV